MVVAVPASERSVDSTVDDRFARCPFFCIYHVETGRTEFKENSLKDGSGGVGPQVVEFLARQGVNTVYAMEFGPKAKNMMDKVKMESVVISEKKTVREIIEMSNK